MADKAQDIEIKEEPITITTAAAQDYPGMLGACTPWILWPAALIAFAAGAGAGVTRGMASQGGLREMIGYGVSAALLGGGGAVIPAALWSLLPDEKIQQFKKAAACSVVAAAFAFAAGFGSNIDTNLTAVKNGENPYKRPVVEAPTLVKPVSHTPAPH